MNEDDSALEVVGLFDNDGRQYTTDEIEVPPLCLTCVRRPAEGLTGLLCQLTWLDRMLTPEDERETFSCHAYEKSNGPQ